VDGSRKSLKTGQFLKHRSQQIPALAPVKIRRPCGQQRLPSAPPCPWTYGESLTSRVQSGGEEPRGSYCGFVGSLANPCPQATATCCCSPALVRSAIDAQ
jgi:hypothetical protein